MNLEQIPPTEPISELVPAPNHKSSIFSALIALLLISSTIYLFYQNIQLKKQVTTLTKKQTSPIPSPTSNPLGNWKTFTNSAYNITIQYPVDAQLILIEPAQYRLFGVNITLSNQNIQYVTTRISIQVVGNKKTPYTQLAQSFFAHDTGWMNDPNTPFTPIQHTDIGSANAESMTQTLCPSAGQYCEKTEYYFTDNDTYNFLITATYPIDSNQIPLFKQVTDQILSTFQFVDKTPTTYTCPSSGWVDCMPGTTVKLECSTEAMTWYKTNCSNFQGAAL